MFKNKFLSEGNSVEEGSPRKFNTDFLTINETSSVLSSMENTFMEGCSLNEVKNFNKMILETDDMETRSRVLNDDVSF